MSRAFSLSVLACALLPACPRSTSAPVTTTTTTPRREPALPDWPPRPQNAFQLATLLATHRPPPGSDPAGLPTAREVEDALRGGHESLVAAGEEPVLEYLTRRIDEDPARDAYVLVGTFHDAPGQVRAFARLVGPAGARRFTHVAVEQYMAAGRWPDAPEARQSGDGEALARWNREGTAEALDALRTAQRAHDFAAWKYGYIPEVLELSALARAAGATLCGLDMPRALWPEPAWPEEELNRLRELHGWLALRDALAREDSRGPHRVALFWGAGHVTPEGFRRWLPPEARALTVYLFGHRRAALRAPEPDAPVEAQLRARWVLDAPVLLALDPRAERLALLLPDAWWGGALERVRTPRVDGDAFVGTPAGRLEVRSGRPGTFEMLKARSSSGTFIDRAQVTDGAATLTPGEGTFVYRFTTADDRVTTVGSVTLASGEGASLDLDPTERLTRLQLVVPPGALREP